MNTLQFIESILNHHPNHCKRFIEIGGLQKVIKLLTPKALPDDFPQSQGVHKIASLLRSVFVLSKREDVIKIVFYEFFSFIKDRDLKFTKSTEEYVRFYGLDAVKRPSYLCSIVDEADAQVQPSQQDGAESELNQDQRTYQNNLLIMQSMLQVINQLISGKEFNLERSDNKSIGRREVVLENCMISSNIKTTQSQMQTFSHQYRILHLFGHELAHIQRNLSWETSVVYFNYLNRGVLDSFERSMVEKNGDDQTQEAQPGQAKTKLEAATDAMDDDLAGTNTKPQKIAIPSPENKQLLTKIPEKIKVMFVTAYQITKTIPELKSMIGQLIVGPAKIPPSRSLRLPSLIEPILSKPQAILANELVRSTIDTIKFKPVLENLGGAAELDYEKEKILKEKAFQEVLGPHESGPNAEESAKILGLGTNNLDDLPKSNYTDTTFSPKTFSSKNLAINLTRIQIMHHTEGIQSAIKMIFDKDCYSYYYFLVLFYMHGGFDEFHNTFKLSIKLLSDQGRSQVRKNWINKLYQENKLSKSDCQDDLSKQNLHNKKLFEKLRAYGQKVDKLNQTAAMKYIDLYLSLLDKLTDCDEIFNNQYHFRVEQFINYIKLSEQMLSNHDAETEEDHVFINRSRDILNKKAEIIIPLIVGKMHVISFRTVEELIKNKFVMDNDNIAPNVLNLLISITKNEKKLINKMEEATKKLSKIRNPDPRGHLGSHNRILNRNSLLSGQLTDLLDGNFQNENISQLMNSIWEDPVRQVDSLQGTHERFHRLERIMQQLTNSTNDIAQQLGVDQLSSLESLSDRIRSEQRNINNSSGNSSAATTASRPTPTTNSGVTVASNSSANNTRINAVSQTNVNSTSSVNMTDSNTQINAVSSTNTNEVTPAAVSVTEPVRQTQPDDMTDDAPTAATTVPPVTEQNTIIPRPPNVDTIMEMGFDEIMAVTAHNMYPNDLQTAITACLDGSISQADLDRTIQALSVNETTRPVEAETTNGDENVETTATLPETNDAMDTQENTDQTPTSQSNPADSTASTAPVTSLPLNTVYDNLVAADTYDEDDEGDDEEEDTEDDSSEPDDGLSDNIIGPPIRLVPAEPRSALSSTTGTSTDQTGSASGQGLSREISKDSSHTANIFKKMEKIEKSERSQQEIEREKEREREELEILESRKFENMPLFHPGSKPTTITPTLPIEELEKRSRYIEKCFNEFPLAFNIRLGELQESWNKYQKWDSLENSNQIWRYIINELLDRRPMLVEKIAAMVSEMKDKNGANWSSGIVQILVDNCNNLFISADQKTEDDQDKERFEKLQTRLVLLTIFCGDANLSKLTVNIIKKVNLISNMVTCLNKNHKKSVPNWLASAFNLFEKFNKQTAYQFRLDLLADYKTWPSNKNKKCTWRYLCHREKAWKDVSSLGAENDRITTAFMEGQEKVSIKSFISSFATAQTPSTAVINFRNMSMCTTTPGQNQNSHSSTQNNNSNSEESYKQIMMFFESNGNQGNSELKSILKNDPKKTEENLKNDEENLQKIFKKQAEFLDLQKNDEIILLDLLMGYLDFLTFGNLDKHGSEEMSDNKVNLDLILRIILRLTRTKCHAETFFKNNGHEKLVNLDCKTYFTGLHSLVVLILRNLIDIEQDLFTANLKETLKSVQNFGIERSHCRNIYNKPQVYKNEFTHILNNIMPLAAKDLELFCQQILGNLSLDIFQSGSNIDPIAFRQHGHRRAYSDKSKLQQFKTSFFMPIKDTKGKVIYSSETNNPSPSSKQKADSKRSNIRNLMKVDKDSPIFAITMLLSKKLTNRIDEMETISDIIAKSNIDPNLTPTTSSNLPKKRSFSSIFSSYYLIRVISELTISYPSIAYLMVNRERNLLQKILSKVLVSKRGILAVEAQYSLSKENQSSANTASGHHSAEKSKKLDDPIGTSENLVPQHTELEQINLKSQIAYKDKCWSRPVLLLISVLSSSPIPKVQACVAKDLCNAFVHAKTLPEGVEKHVNLRAILGLLKNINHLTLMSPPNNQKSQQSLSSPGQPKQDRRIIDYRQLSLGQAQSSFPAILLKNDILKELARLPLVLKLDSPCFQSTINLNLQAFNQLTKLARNLELQKIKVEAERKVQKFFNKKRGGQGSRKKPGKTEQKITKSRKTSKNHDPDTMTDTVDSEISEVHENAMNLVMSLDSMLDDYNDHDMADNNQQEDGEIVNPDDIEDDQEDDDEDPEENEDGQVDDDDDEENDEIIHQNQVATWNMSDEEDRDLNDDDEVDQDHDEDDDEVDDDEDEEDEENEDYTEYSDDYDDDGGYYDETEGLPWMGPAGGEYDDDEPGWLGGLDDMAFEDGLNGPPMQLFGMDRWRNNVRSREPGLRSIAINANDRNEMLEWARNNMPSSSRIESLALVNQLMMMDEQNAATNDGIPNGQYEIDSQNYAMLNDLMNMRNFMRLSGITGNENREGNAGILELDSSNWNAEAMNGPGAFEIEIIYDNDNVNGRRVGNSQRNARQGTPNLDASRALRLPVTMSTGFSTNDQDNPSVDDVYWGMVTKDPYTSELLAEFKCHKFVSYNAEEEKFCCVEGSSTTLMPAEEYVMKCDEPENSYLLPLDPEIYFWGVEIGDIMNLDAKNTIITKTSMKSLRQHDFKFTNYTEAPPPPSSRTPRDRMYHRSSPVHNSVVNFDLVFDNINKLLSHGGCIDEVEIKDIALSGEKSATSSIPKPNLSNQSQISDKRLRYQPVIYMPWIAPPWTSATYRLCLPSSLSRWRESSNIIDGIGKLAPLEVILQSILKTKFEAVRDKEIKLHSDAVKKVEEEKKELQRKILEEKKRIKIAKQKEEEAKRKILAAELEKKRLEEEKAEQERKLKEAEEAAEEAKKALEAATAAAALEEEKKKENEKKEQEETNNDLSTPSRQESRESRENQTHVVSETEDDMQIDNSNEQVQVVTDSDIESAAETTPSQSTIAMPPPSVTPNPSNNTQTTLPSNNNDEMETDAREESHSINEQNSVAEHSDVMNDASVSAERIVGVGSNRTVITPIAEETTPVAQPVETTGTSAITEPAATNPPITAEEPSFDPDSVEALDASVLNILPLNMAKDEIRDRIRRTAGLRRTRTPIDHTTPLVRDSFLSQLNPEIKELIRELDNEERQNLRRIANIQTEAPNPNDVLASLPEELRQEVLTDMQPEQLAVLDTTMQNQAAQLQRNNATRRPRQIHHTSRSHRVSNSRNADILRYGDGYGRRGGQHRNTTEQSRRNEALFSELFKSSNQASVEAQNKGKISIKDLLSCRNDLSEIRPQSVIDQESLVCLLSLFFVPEKCVDRLTFNTILKNILFTRETKVWLAKSLIEILQLTNSQMELQKQNERNDSMGSLSGSSQGNYRDRDTTLSSIQPLWLNYQVDMSLGQRANVFLFYESIRDNLINGGGMSDSVNASRKRTISTTSSCLSNCSEFGTNYKRNNKNYDIKLMINPQACTFVNKNVLNTLNEVNDQLLDTLFWLKSDIKSITKNEPNLFQKLVQLDEYVSNNKLNSNSSSIDMISIFNDQLPGQQLVDTINTQASTEISLPSEATKKLNTSTIILNLGQPFKTTKQMSITLLADLLCMIDHQMIQNQMHLLEKFLEVLTKCCRKLPIIQKDWKLDLESSDFNSFDENLKRAIKFVVASLTSVNTSDQCVKKLTNVLINLAKYSISLGQLIEREIQINVISLGKKLVAHLNQLHIEVLKHNAELDKNERSVSGLNGNGTISRKRNVSFNQDLYHSTNNSTANALNAIAKQKEVKENKKTLKCELQLPSMQNLTSKSSNQAYLLRVLKVLIQIRKKTLPLQKSAKQINNLALRYRHTVILEDESTQGHLHYANVTSLYQSATTNVRAITGHHPANQHSNGYSSSSLLRAHRGFDFSRSSRIPRLGGDYHSYQMMMGQTGGAEDLISATVNLDLFENEEAAPVVAADSESNIIESPLETAASSANDATNTISTPVAQNPNTTCTMCTEEPQPTSSSSSTAVSTPSVPTAASIPKTEPTGAIPTRNIGRINIQWHKATDNWILTSNGQNTGQYLELDQETYEKQIQENELVQKRVQEQREKSRVEKEKDKEAKIKELEEQNRILKEEIAMKEAQQSGQKGKASEAGDVGSSIDLKKPDKATISMDDESTNKTKELAKPEKEEETIITLADNLSELEPLWEILSKCLESFDDSGDSNAYLIVQNAVEAFFMVHSLDEKENKMFKELQKNKEAKESGKDKVSIQMSSNKNHFLNFRGLGWENNVLFNKVTLYKNNSVAKVKMGKGKHVNKLALAAGLSATVLVGHVSLRGGSDVELTSRTRRSTKAEYQPKYSLYDQAINDGFTTLNEDFNFDDVFMFQNDEIYPKTTKKDGSGQKNLSVLEKESLTSQMNNIFNQGWSKMNFLLDSDNIEVAQPAIKENGQMENTYDGLDNINPIIQSILEDTHCDLNGLDLFSGKYGQVDLSFFVPVEPVLSAESKYNGHENGNAPITEYKNYFNFINRFLTPTKNFHQKGGKLSPKSRFNIATFSSDNYKMVLKGKFSGNPWSTLANVGKNQLTYPKVKIKGGNSITVPFVNYNEIARKFLEVGGGGGESSKITRKSTFSSDTTSIFIWLISTPPLYNGFLNENTKNSILNLRKRTVIVPIGVGIDQKIWEKFMVLWFPEMADKYSKDKEFSGHFLVKEAKNLLDQNFIRNLNQYLCLAISRTSCRAIRRGQNIGGIWMAPTTPNYETMTTDWFTTAEVTTTSQNIDDLNDFNIIRSVNNSPDYDTFEQKNTPDSCCGHDLYRAKMYDSEISECCHGGRVMKKGENGFSRCPDLETEEKPKKTKRKKN